MPQYLNTQQLLAVWRSRPGLLPVNLDAQSGVLTWRDVGRYHFYEGFFDDSLDACAALQATLGLSRESFTSDASVLQADELASESLAPAGFIFHAGRCGSTLLAKALARSRAVLLVSEAGPLNQVWPFLAGDWCADLPQNDGSERLYRNLVLALGRQRVATHRAYFVKFTSYNILFYAWIRRVFPQVPALFLYREPSAVLNSLRRGAPAWRDTPEESFHTAVTGGAGDTNDYFEQVLANFYAAALQAEGLAYCDYKQLTAHQLPALLEFFGVTVTAEELPAMQRQFGYYSKSDFTLQPFQTVPSDATVVSADCRNLYARLARRIEFRLEAGSLGGFSRLASD